MRTLFLSQKQSKHTLYTVSDSHFTRPLYAFQPCSSIDSGSNDMNCCISRVNSSSVMADDGPGDGAVDPPQVPNQSPGGAMANMSEIPTSLAVLLFAGFTASENASVSRCMQRHCQTIGVSFFSGSNNLSKN